MAGLVEQNINPASPAALTQLLEFARAEFDRMQLPIEVEAIWWPRFENLAPSIIDWERGLEKHESFVEISARATQIDDTGVTLSGRADRIDILDGKNAEILDFKTGSTPSPKQAATLMAPQLALEAALLTRNAFEDCKNVVPTKLAYIRLTSKGEVIEQSLDKMIKDTVQQLSEEAWARLVELMNYYKDPKIGYLSRAMPPLTNYEGDYDHLARVMEWSSGIEAAGDE